MREEIRIIHDDVLYELNDIKQRIDNNPLESYVRYLVLYSIIKASGSIEVSFKKIIFDHLSKGANEEAITYFEKMILESSANPSTDRISNCLSRINIVWKRNFQQAMSANSEKKRDLNSLVSLRNSVAHGSTTSVTIQVVLQYFYSSWDIIKILYDIVNNSAN